MWQSVWHFILKIFGKIENNPKLPVHDVAVLPEGIAIEVLPEEEIPHSTILDAIQPKVTLPEPEPPGWPDVWEVIDEIVERPFDGPLHDIPSRRQTRVTKLSSGGQSIEHGVYDIFGRPSKEPKTNSNKQYRTTRQKVHENLPGTWNNGKPRLYMEESAGQHLREALGRAKDLEERLSILLEKPHLVISSILKMGAYSYRHISRDPSKPLSNHSWSIAVDIDSASNRGVRYGQKWQRRIQKDGKSIWINATPFSADRGPVNEILPYSQQYFEVFPNSVPFELVMCFKSVGFSWGGDWGRAGWQKVVNRFGVKFDQTDLEVKQSKVFQDAMTEWDDFRFFDGMHFELQQRGEWAKSLWQRQQNSLRHNTNVA